MKEPVDHILRPQLPWRTGGGITECGYNADSVSTLTRAIYFERLKEMGQQRAAMLTCMTCSHTASRWATWEDDPRQAIQRELEWEGSGRWKHRDRGDRLRDELIAIAALVEGNMHHFHALISDIEQRRVWLGKKAAHAEKVKAKATTRSGGN